MPKPLIGALLFFAVIGAVFLLIRGTGESGTGGCQIVCLNHRIADLRRRVRRLEYDATVCTGIVGPTAITMYDGSPMQVAFLRTDECQTSG